MKSIFIFIALSIISCLSLAETRIVSVHGKSTYKVEPDTIHIFLAIANSDKKSIADAKAEVDKKSAAVVSALLSSGISEADIRSTEFNVYLEDEDYRNDCPQKPVPEVSRKIEVTLRNINSYGSTLDILVKNGVTSIESVEAGLSSIDAEEKNALKLAITDAKNQAEFLTKNLGGKLGKVQNIGKRQLSKNYDVEEIVVTGFRASKKNSEPPYEFKPAKIEISASVYVEFEIE